ncbi:hypothetical protein HPB51_017503 [Rhipicephalus microplus]|uniref:Uncharacterized protein n=1 Tax=Rhipicephalus microplus TaxID=6941 RepID=A0A9J6F626_RHIMP|nr:hypothetical protein HPB51_017503 [Rhipicephalus microplus]
MDRAAMASSLGKEAQEVVGGRLDDRGSAGEKKKKHEKRMLTVSGRWCERGGDIVEKWLVDVFTLFVLLALQEAKCHETQCWTDSVRCLVSRGKLERSSLPLGIAGSCAISQDAWLVPIPLSISGSPFLSILFLFRLRPSSSPARSAFSLAALRGVRANSRAFREIKALLLLLLRLPLLLWYLDFSPSSLRAVFCGPTEKEARWHDPREGWFFGMAVGGGRGRRCLRGWGKSAQHNKCDGAEEMEGREPSNLLQQ